MTVSEKPRCSTYFRGIAREGLFGLKSLLP